MAVSLRIGRWIERTRSSSGAMWITFEAATFHRQGFRDAICYYYDHSRLRLTKAPHRESTSEPPLSSAAKQRLQRHTVLCSTQSGQTRYKPSGEGEFGCATTRSNTQMWRTLQQRYAVTTYRGNVQLGRYF
jgi:hypothetical protein